MTEREQLSPAARWFGLIVGVLLLPVALVVFVVMGIVWTVAAILDGDGLNIAVGLLCTGLGAVLVDAAVRLILGRPRSGGGLLPPAVVFGFQLLTVVGLVWSILANDSGWLPESMAARIAIAALAIAALALWSMRPPPAPEPNHEPETMSADAELGKAALDRIRREYSHLTMSDDLYDAPLDATLDIPSQAGLDFQVNLSVDGDELYLGVGDSFWLSWFPSSKPVVVEDYLDAVRGVLDGTYRLVEHRRWGRPFKVVLQMPHRGGWKNAGTSGTLGALIPITFSKTILQNQRASRHARS
jgi:hypothetical protein